MIQNSFNCLVVSWSHINLTTFLFKFKFISFKFILKKQANLKTKTFSLHLYEQFTEEYDKQRNLSHYFIFLHTLTYLSWSSYPDLSFLHIHLIPSISF